MSSMAASGGYYISAPCRWIVANDLTITGSIGVIMSTWNYRGLMNKVGIRPYTFKSGKFKDMLSGSKEPSEITKDEEDMINALVDETFVRFKTVVGEGRKKAADRNKGKGKVLTENWDKLADGRVMSGTEAFKHGFVDELGNFDAAVKTTASMVGLTADEANLIEYRQRVDLAELFQLFGNTESKAVKVDLGLKSSPLRAGYLYFIAPTLIQ
jgi:protease-4